MIGEHFSSLWAAIAPGVANHLWQSTLFAIAAGLLTLLLRKHNARARHWLWRAASLKFLVPFSLLVTIGSRLSPDAAAAPSVRPVIYFAMEEITQPFSQLGVHVTPAHAPSMASSILLQLTQAIGALWLAGFLAVLDHHRGVRAEGQRAARGDAHRFARVDRPGGARAHGDLAGHFQPDRPFLGRARDIGGDDGVPVDARASERRHVFDGADRAR